MSDYLRSKRIIKAMEQPLLHNRQKKGSQRQKENIKPSDSIIKNESVNKGVNKGVKDKFEGVKDTNIIDGISVIISAYKSAEFIKEIINKEKLYDNNKIPAFINNYNRITLTKNTADWLSKYNCIPIIIDNNSTYEPLLDYYNKTEYVVIKLNQNLRSRALWNANILQVLGLENKRYIYTDPDLNYDNIPDNWLEILNNGLNKYSKYSKIGFSLKIEHLKGTNNEFKEKKYKWESQFWIDKLEDLYFSANIDTTFALYREGVVKHTYSAIRTNIPYCAIHIPWEYDDVSLLPKDEIEYLKTADKNGFGTTILLENTNLVEQINKLNYIKILIHQNNLSQNIFKNVEIFLKSLVYDKNTLIILSYQNFAIDELINLKNEYKEYKFIAYQLEQLEYYDKNRVYDKLNLFDEIWDYDENNYQILKDRGYNNLKILKPHYCEELKRIDQNIKKDIDVLFYGTINNKRQIIIDELKKNNINVVTLFNIHGKELDSYIGRSKIILNTHYYDSHIQEQVRLFYLIINNKCIISEPSVYNNYCDLIIETTDYVKTIKELLKNDKWKNYNNISNSLIVFT